MSVIYNRPDGTIRGASIAVIGHQWGRFGGQKACLLRFQFTFTYVKEQKFKRANLEVYFHGLGGAANPRIEQYGPVTLDTAPTNVDRVLTASGQIAMHLPIQPSVNASLGASQQNSWTQQHAGKVFGSPTARKMGTHWDTLTFRFEQDDKAQTGVPPIVRAAAVVLSDTTFNVSAKVLSTDPIGFAWLPCYKGRIVDQERTIEFEDKPYDSLAFNSDVWSKMVLLGTGTYVDASSRGGIAFD
jgi:hypothetical protein